MLRLGGPVFINTEDPRELAAAHVAAGWTAAYCPEVDPGDGAAVRALRDAFAAVDVPFAEAGAWCNLLAPDPGQRRRNHDYACRRLALADELGARCAVDFLGTLDPGSAFGPHPANLSDDTFAAGVEVVRSIIDTVKPRRAVFSLEMMQWILPDSVECYERILRAVDRDRFGVHVDPVNLILTPRQYYDTRRLLREIFGRLGPRIASCHAKDIRLRGELALHFDEVPPGQGVLDYRAYLGEILALGREVPLMLEHLGSEADYRAAGAYVRSCLPGVTEPAAAPSR
jgi:sugar phosphate isomerase/epimerase